ncbi:MAG TPA: permease [Flavobacteriales bacterium]|nr:permease [Flavobacteriales bacterium]HMR28710.1 permease [Flavobacteriales bacterium]
MFDWLDSLIAWLVYDTIGLDAATHWGQALHFFFYDSIKILILLFLVTFLMGIVNAYFPIDRIRNFLSRNKLYGGEYLLASTFGAITPFCSCSSVPLFIGFVKGGIPMGVTLAFLITSPLVNEVAIAIFIGMFGVKTTLLYAASGILLGTIGGYVLGRFRLERFLTPWVQGVIQQAEMEGAYDGEQLTFSQRLPGVAREALGIVKSVILYVLIGIGIGALMHGFVPTGFFEKYISADNPLAVPLAVILGVPMYANAAGVLPVIQVLVQKGVPLGTAIAFMMAVIGLSLPEATLLKKVMTMKLIAIFFGTVAIFIILSGYLFNAIL